MLLSWSIVWKLGKSFCMILLRDISLGFRLDLLWGRLEVFMRFYWSIEWLRAAKSLELFMGWIINDYIPVRVS